MLFAGLVVFASAFFLASLATLFARRQARRMGFIDIPTERKDHERAVPLGGGHAMFMTFVVTILAGYAVTYMASKGWGLAWMPSCVVQESAGILAKFPRVLLILAGGMGMLIIGWIDDGKDLSPVVKLVAQAVIATCLVLGGITVTVFISNKILAGIITVLWMVGVVNAFNFLDNMDGLCGGVAFVAGAIFAFIAAQTGQMFVAAMLLAYLGMLAGFLVFNFPPATIFMGDAGSFFIGFVIAALTVVFTFRKEPEPVHAILTPLLILALPIFDTVCVMGIRLFKGNALFIGDHSHVSHRLLSLGMSKKVALLTIYLMTFCTGLAAVMLRQVSLMGAGCAVIQVVCFLVLIFLVERAGRRA